MKIGVLALQGSFKEHITILRKLEAEAKLNIEVVEVRLPEQLDEIDGLIIPGGESTTIMQLLDNYNFDLKKFNKQFNKPIFGTCAGCIVLAKFGLLNIKVERNAYGPQLYSFIDDVEFIFEPKSIKERSKGVFIRAPRIISAGEDVLVLGKHKKEPVLVKQGNILGATFHPELTEDTRVHELFVKIIDEVNRK